MSIRCIALVPADIVGAHRCESCVVPAPDITSELRVAHGKGKLALGLLGMLWSWAPLGIGVLIGSVSLMALAPVAGLWGTANSLELILDGNRMIGDHCAALPSALMLARRRRGRR